MSDPCVSVLLPVRNGLPYVRDAVASLLAQSFRDFEVVAIDDGSTDGSGDWLRALTDPRVRVVAGAGAGLARALNTGLAAARGRYLARQDADDLSHPGRFARQVAFLDGRPDVAVLATRAAYVGPEGEPVENDWTRTVRSQQDTALAPDELRALLPLTCGIVHGSVMMRAGVVRDAGGYDESYDTAQDYDLWLRLLTGHQFAKLPDLLYTHRLHPGQLSGQRAERQRESAVRAKLSFVRRAYPALPNPAVLVVADDTRGTPLYRAAAPAAGFTVSADAAAFAAGGGHVLAVTDFTGIDAWSARLAGGAAAGRVVREGNLFVRLPEGA